MMRLFTAATRIFASPLFSKTTYTNIKNKPRLSANPVCKKADCFDKECHTAKQAYFTAISSLIFVKQTIIE